MIEYILKHGNDMVKVLGTIGTFIGIILSVFKRLYTDVSIFRERRAIKYIKYLNQYDNYLGENDKDYLKYEIASEIMFDVTKIKSDVFRNIIIKLKQKGLDCEYIDNVKKLKIYAFFNSDRVQVKVKPSYYVTYCFEKIFSAYFFTLAFIVLVVFLSKVDIWINAGGDALDLCLVIFSMILFMGIGTYLLLLSPSKTQIKELNDELSKYKVSTEI
ncbi:hypothetical protein ID852_07395 [Xenorhabdus sp. 42]|uniref:Uncharacterized protein n=1 Tax=Xenorhabdus szentirmaii TaxID=290112 RepID=A0AAW3YU36_9GAMM|nr:MULTISPECIES: hypothetical protein [unclassified Xenorhabdus]MBD2781327.1 hypothetical protein [Xenorhabdus sp. 38]MBD2792909.1 hypothetical protein [Xenorhabdus sp. CUL]MBD2800836.1 hypothetical protein [Xenorhabdus sp. M]MBD2806277.1 hypothetical protein [Xenorhabdus sp. ZM]MBD2820519.1 hypothetical protein [Xenorhabdus sp. 42]